GIALDSPFTTPYGDELARFARDAEAAGARRLILEVSSHALRLHRVDAVRFAVAAFTHLTQDPLDFHRPLWHYGHAQAPLLTELSPGCSVLNVDDPFGARVAAGLGGARLRVSAKGDPSAELYATDARLTREGITAQLHFEGRRLSLTSPLVGAHNLENLLVS